MNVGDLNTEYFLVIEPREDDRTNDLLPSLSADECTAGLPYDREALPPSCRPLVFVNGAKGFRDKRGQTTMKSPPDVMFEGSNPMVRGATREKLLAFDIPHLVLQPAVYIDDWGVRHEDYWYLTFTERLDCWSRTDSEYEKGHPVRIGPGQNLYEVYSIRLDKERLGALPLDERRLFQLGGATNAFVLAHESVAGLFRACGGRGVQVLALSEYPDAY